MFKGQVKTIALYLVVITVILVISAVLAFQLMLTSWDNNPNTNDNRNKSHLLSSIQNEFNVLLLGADKERDGQQRSDTLMVANIDLEQKKISLVSIPRDTRVEFSDGSYHKINAAYAYGGLKLLQNTVANFLGVKIDYYLEVDYNDFIDLVDLIDGIDLNITKKLQYSDQAAGLNINLAAGKKNLTGEEALGYVRFRHDKLGDLGRINRQQKFLKAAADQLFSAKTILQTPKLINQVSQTIKSNLPTAKLLAIATILNDFSLDNLEMTTLPGEIGYINGVSYWLVKDVEVDSVLTSLSFNLLNQGGFSVNGS